MSRKGKKRNYKLHLNQSVLNHIEDKEMLDEYLIKVMKPKHNNDENYYIDKTLSCPSGKETYATRQDAENAIRQRHNSNKRSYRCVHCGHFHLTSNDNTNRRQKSVVRDKIIKSHKKVNENALNSKEREILTQEALKRKRSLVINLGPSKETENKPIKVGSFSIKDILGV